MSVDEEATRPTKKEQKWYSVITQSGGVDMVRCIWRMCKGDGWDGMRRWMGSPYITEVSSLDV